MKKNVKTNTLGLLLLVLVLLVAIFVPSWLLNRDYRSHFNIVETVPQNYYLASNTAMAKRKSELLSSLDRLKLITGAWDSTSKDATPSDALLNESTAVSLAKEKIEYLYKNNLYPCSLNSGFNNWYSWSTKLTSYQDNTFHTYNTVLWTITFTKYDNSTTHTVLLTDDGMLLSAQVNERSSNIIAFNSKAADFWDTELLFGDKKIQIDSVNGVAYNTLEESIREAYPSLPLCYFNEQNCYRVYLSKPDNSKESYLLYQYKDPYNYGIGFITPTSK